MDDAGAPDRSGDLDDLNFGAEDDSIRLPGASLTIRAGLSRSGLISGHVEHSFWGRKKK